MTRSIALQFERAQYYGATGLDNVVFRTDYPTADGRRPAPSPTRAVRLVADVG